MAKFDSPWGEIRTRTLSGTLWRVVESQEEIATVGLVDNLDEQALLEDMLEACKPESADDVGDLDYLLSTPFRYPPLTWGSRFGSTQERGMFYGSETLNTALAEVAYYRFVFYQGMSVPLDTSLQTQHLAFQAAYRCQRAVDLMQAPFEDTQAALTSPDSYRFTQQLGSHLRDNHCDGIRFTSARCPDAGVNFVITTASALIRQRPANRQNIACLTTADQVSFKLLQRRPATLDTTRHFPKSGFMVNGVLPIAA